MIQVRGLTVKFDTLTVLDNVDLAIQRGEVLGILGPGGAGKSVLIKLVCALLRPTSGTVFIAGEDVHALNSQALARVRTQIGMLFQNYALFDFMTVFQNVAFPLQQSGQFSETEMRTRVLARLEQVGLLHAQALYPNELSGGMKKRVSLARATITEAPILLYDDPTAGLDPVTSSKIFDLVRALHRPNETTTVVISHDVDRLRGVCDRFALLYHGKVLFQGTLKEAMESDHPIVHTFFTGEGDGESL